MAKRMSGALIALNVAGVLVFLGWLGWQYYAALGRAYGTANPSTGPGDIDWVFWIVATGSVACIIGCWFVPASYSKFVALGPLILVGVGQGFVAWREHARFARWDREEAAEQAVRKAKFSRWSRDFVGTTVLSEVRETFLTFDPDLKIFVRIDVNDFAEVEAHPVGKVEGDWIESMENEKSFRERYRKYVDREGKTISDRYQVRFNPALDLYTLRLEKYKQP